LFSDIFEIYDEYKAFRRRIKCNVNQNKEFNEDNLMRYHFVELWSGENYDSSMYVFTIPEK
jgi:hypothetical protein